MFNARCPVSCADAEESGKANGDGYYAISESGAGGAGGAGSVGATCEF
jgi:hypothetical protein